MSIQVYRSARACSFGSIEPVVRGLPGSFGSHFSKNLCAPDGPDIFPLAITQAAGLLFRREIERNSPIVRKTRRTRKIESQDRCRTA